jgi:hypothetical protein
MADSGGGGGGGGAFDPMDFRIDRLEADMSELKADMKAMLKDVSYIRGRLDAMPTTIQLLMFVIAIFLASGLTRYFGH